MTLRDFLSSLRNGYKFYESIGEANTCRLLHSLPASTAFNTLALDTTVPYPDVFFLGLDLQQFNFQLNDYSYFQFSYTSADDLRYAFYPSPYSTKEILEIRELYQSYHDGQIDSEALSAFVQDVNLNYARPLIRYEYNLRQYKQGAHPASHFHIGTFGEDRWALHRRLTPYVFCMIVGKLYFSHHWETLTVWDATGKVRQSNEFDAALIQERSNCVVTDANFFSEYEQRCFHYA